MSWGSAADCLSSLQLIVRGAPWTNTWKILNMNFKLLWKSETIDNLKISDVISVHVMLLEIS